MIHFLFNIAKADGSISKAEIEKLLEFTQLLNISRVDFESIKAMFFKSSDSDYKILEVDKNCSNEDLKKAYRELAKKHHPDTGGDEKKILLIKICFIFYLYAKILTIQKN